MPYATIDDIRAQIREQELIGLTDEDDTGAVVEAVVNTAITDAGVEIDGHLGGRYTLPLSPVPDIIRKLCVDIAIFNLYALGAGPPQSRKDRYDNAVKFLRSVAKGDISLGVNDPAGTGPADTPATSSTDRTFDPDTLAGY
jgi:phage gp36-like protein